VVVSGKLFLPTAMLESKLAQFSGIPLYGRLLAVPSNVTLAGLPVANTLAYLDESKVRGL
jgi:hypothetical protein